MKEHCELVCFYEIKMIDGKMLDSVEAKVLNDDLFASRIFRRWIKVELAEYLYLLKREGLLSNASRGNSFSGS